MAKKWTCIFNIGENHFVERWIETVETAKAVGMKRGLGEAIEGGPQAAEQFFKGKRIKKSVFYREIF